MILVNNCCFV